MLTHSVRKPGGYIIITDPINGITEKETVMCCHCGKHWTVNPGSGTIRGFCRGCNARTCGHVECSPCYNFEKRLDDYEAGRLLIL